MLSWYMFHLKCDKIYGSLQDCMEFQAQYRNKRVNRADMECFLLEIHVNLVLLFALAGNSSSGMILHPIRVAYPEKFHMFTSRVINLKTLPWVLCLFYMKVPSD